MRSRLFPVVFHPAAPVANAAPVASNVEITGTPVVGETLTGNYTYFDADGDLESGTTFRWLKNDDEIVGATAQTYVVQEADAGSSIQFEVWVKAATGIQNEFVVLSDAVVIDALGFSFDFSYAGNSSYLVLI